MKNTTDVSYVSKVFHSFIFLKNNIINLSFYLFYRDSNYKKKVLVFFLCLAFCFQNVSFSQTTSEKEISSIIALDSTTVLHKISPLFLGTIKTQSHESFKTIKKLSFTQKKIDFQRIGFHYWSTFFIKNQQQANTQYIQFQLPKADKLLFYIPKLNGSYQKYELGLSVPKKNISHIDDVTKLIVITKGIDFKKPFYINNIPMSIFGFNAINEQITFITSKEKPLLLNSDFQSITHKQSLFDFQFYSLLGMIFISFLFFLIHFFLTKKVHFLFYALYLFFLFLNYSHRVFYFYEFYEKIHPHIYFYLNQIGAVFGNLAYMLFIYYFINIKKNYPSFYPIYKAVLQVFSLFILVYCLIISINPFYRYHEILMDAYIYTLSAISFGFVLYMIIRKTIIHTTLVFIGSVLLLIGYVLAILNDNFFIMVPIVVLESFIFMGVISYLDLKYYKQALERDKLIEINTYKTEMYGNISHEFKTPLTLINGLSTLLISKSENTEEKEKLKGILHSGNQLLNLVNQMLGLVSVDANKTKLAYINDDIISYLKNGVSLYQQFAKFKEQQLVFTSSIVALKMDFDADKLQKIINNLVSNSLKFTPKKGVVTFDVTKKNNLLILQITDTGTGIEPQHLPHIFERYYKTFDTENNLGNGIGMALTKELVELLNGEITVQSTVGKGTTFTIKLPIKNNVNTALKTVQSTSFISELDTTTQKEAKKTTTNKTILIVEDNVAIRNFIKLLLGNFYKIYTAKNGLEGLQIAQNKTVHFIISDVLMPKMDGLSFCKAIKSDVATSHIPFIIISAKTSAEDRVKGYKLGIDAYLAKPFNNDELIVIIKNLLEKKETQIKYFSKLLAMKETSKKAVEINQIDVNFIKTIQEIALSASHLNTDEIAHKLATSRTQLHRKIKMLTGKSITQYINHIRIEKAKILLQENTLQVNEIAIELGFESANYFTRIFKKETGITPKMYLKKP